MYKRRAGHVAWQKVDADGTVKGTFQRHRKNWRS